MLSLTLLAMTLSFIPAQVSAASACNVSNVSGKVSKSTKWDHVSGPNTGAYAGFRFTTEIGYSRCTGIATSRTTVDWVRISWQQFGPTNSKDWSCKLAGHVANITMTTDSIAGHSYTHTWKCSGGSTIPHSWLIDVPNRTYLGGHSKAQRCTAVKVTLDRGTLPLDWHATVPKLCV